MKTVKNDTMIFGHATKETAEREASLVVNERVRIVGVLPGDGRGVWPADATTFAYFIVPEGEKCPCCSSVVKFGEDFK